MTDTSTLLIGILRDKFNVAVAMDASTKVSELGIDSLDVINFLYSAEEETGVKIPDEAIVEEKLERIADFAAYIDARRT